MTDLGTPAPDALRALELSIGGMSCAACAEPATGWTGSTRGRWTWHPSPAPR